MYETNIQMTIKYEVQKYWKKKRKQSREKVKDDDINIVIRTES